MRINKALLVTVLILGFYWVLGWVTGVIGTTVIDLMETGRLMPGFTAGELIVWLQYLRLAVQAIGTYLIVRHFIVSADDGEKRKRSGYRNDLMSENNLRSIDADEEEDRPAETSKRRFQQR